MLGDLQRETGMAVVLITHDLGVVAEFAQQVCVMYAGRIVETGPVGAFFDAPGHPYTQALIASLPSPGATSTRLTTIPGAVPRLGHAPPGCRFAPRCTVVRPACAAQLPELMAVNASQTVACIRPFDYAWPQ